MCLIVKDSPSLPGCEIWVWVKKVISDSPTSYKIKPPPCFLLKTAGAYVSLFKHNPCCFTPWLCDTLSLKPYWKVFLKTKDHIILFELYILIINIQVIPKNIKRKQTPNISPKSIPPCKSHSYWWPVQILLFLSYRNWDCATCVIKIRDI